MKNPNNPINKMRLINNALNDESGLIKLDIVIYKTITITINNRDGNTLINYLYIIQQA